MNEDSSDLNTDDTGESPVKEESSPPSVPAEPCSPALPESSKAMNLEQIIEMTGEFAHLNELVMIHIEKAGGFSGTDAYFRIVQPLLDLLEVEIRVRCSAGMTQQQMKLIVQDWIDEEIKACSYKTQN